MQASSSELHDDEHRVLSPTSTSSSTDEKTTSQDPVLVNDEDTEEGWGDFDQGGQASSNEKSMEPLPAPVEDGNAGGEKGCTGEALEIRL